MPDLSDIRIQATATVHWPEGDPRADEQAPEPEKRDADQEPQKEPEK